MYETIFIKGNRHIDDSAQNMYTVWHSNHKQLDDSFINKITCGESEDKAIDITSDAINLIHKYNTIENIRIIMEDIKKIKDFPDKTKLFVYTNKELKPRITVDIYRGELSQKLWFMSNY